MTATVKKKLFYFFSFLGANLRFFSSHFFPIFLAFETAFVCLYDCLKMYVAEYYNYKYHLKI